MKHFVIAAASFVFIASADVVYAQNGQALYSGSFKCADTIYRTDWKVAKGLEGGIVARVFYQAKGEERVSSLEVHEYIQDGKSALVDKNGATRLTVVPAEDGLSARWIDSGIGYNCKVDFKLQKVREPKAHYDAIFSLLEVDKPSTEQVNQAVKLIEAAPIIFTLPELDQQSYAQRLQTLQQEFWQRYSKQAAEKIATAPLVTPENRQEFTLLLRSALTRSLVNNIGRRWYETVYTALQHNVDRHAVADIENVSGLFSVGDGFCERLSEISSSSYDDNLNMIELAAGLPIDYWKRSNAEDVLKLLRSCEKTRFADQLAQSWPDIEQRQQQVQPLIAEYKRLLALPVTAETFLATENLKPTEEIKTSSAASSELHKRFLGKILDPRREELVEAALADLVKNTNLDALSDEKVQGSIKKLCGSLQREYGLEQAKRTTIEQACKAADDVIAVVHCDAVSAASEISSDLLKSTIEVYEDDDVSLKDMLCKLDDMSTKISLETSGFLFWKKQHLYLTSKQHDDEPLKFTLEPSKKTATWVLATEDEFTQDWLQKQNLDLVKLTACLRNASSCSSR